MSTFIGRCWVGIHQRTLSLQGQQSELGGQATNSGKVAWMMNKYFKICRSLGDNGSFWSLII